MIQKINDTGNCELNVRRQLLYVSAIILHSSILYSNVTLNFEPLDHQL